MLAADVHDRRSQGHPPSTADLLRRTVADAAGWDELRPDQLEAVEQIMVGHDTLVVMPTGSGTWCPPCCSTVHDRGLAPDRPDHLHLGQVVEQLGHPTVLARTATASPPVREEVVEKLHLRDPVQVVRGFDRPTLHLEVETHRDDDRKREAVVMCAMGEPEPGIVHTATRKSARAHGRAPRPPRRTGRSRRRGRLSR